MSKIKRPIRLAIAEDHTLFRQGLLSLLKKEKSIQICFEAENGKIFLDQLECQPIDVALLDFEMPIYNGTQVLNSLRQMNSPVHAIMLSMHTEASFISNALECGAKGYLKKTASFEEIVDAVQNVFFQGFHINDDISRQFFKGPDHSEIISNKNEISAIELEVLELACNGWQSHEIAEVLFYSKKTIDAIRSRLLVKLEAQNTAELLRKALLQGLYIPKTDTEIELEKKQRLKSKQ
jgi:DNA-binding NarL/FixJ family response regulator